MIPGLKPVEHVYLGVALFIVAQQVIFRNGQFDPTSLGAIALFLTLIPAGRKDKRNKPKDDAAAKAQELFKNYLDKLTKADDEE